VNKRYQEALLLQRDRVTRLSLESCNYETSNLKKKLAIDE